MISNFQERGAPGRATATAVALILVSLALSGCSSYPTAEDFHRPVATLASAARPIEGNGSRELADLGADVPDQLRRSFILMETRQPMQAIHLLNRVLFSNPTPSRDTLALAHYLRSRAFQHRGEKDRALDDCRRARELAVAANLRRSCDVEIARLRPVQVARQATTPSPARASGSITIVPRSQWNAARPLGARLDPMQGIRRLTIHHSAVLSRDSSARAVALGIRSIQNFHMQTKHFGDIGYHFLIDPAGRVWEGRDLRYQGAHAGGVNNERNIGICLLGNFVPGRKGQQPAPAQVAAMENLVDLLGSRYDIHRGSVLTHKEIKPGTACPGSRLQAVVNRMRRHLAAHPRRNAEFGTPGGSR